MSVTTTSTNPTYDVYGLDATVYQIDVETANGVRYSTNGDTTGDVDAEVINGVYLANDIEFIGLFFLADCMSPPMFLVGGDSFEDAYENFITEFEEHIAVNMDHIEDYIVAGSPDLNEATGDYPEYEEITMTDSGAWVHTAEIQYMAIDSVTYHTRTTIGDK